MATSIEGRTVGWIGTGVMGASMCAHLIDAGCRVRVHTRTKARAEGLLASGATWVDEPGAVADGAEIVFTMVGTPDDVRAVHLGATGLVERAGAGTVLVDMTTSSPVLASEIADAARQRDVVAMDAPVTGGDVGARQGTLSIMVGGDPGGLETALPFLQRMGSTVVHHGPAGSGQRAKLVNQILIAGTMVGLCEGLLFADAAGLDPEAVLQSVGAGAAGSWSLANLAPRVLRGDLGPGFMVDHFVKDLGLALAEAKRLQLALPGIALAEQLYVSLQANGHGRSGTQALVAALASLSNRPVPGAAGAQAQA